MDFIDLKTQYQRIKSDVQDRVLKVLEQGSYILGPEVRELEQQLAQFAGVKHAVTAASGTDTLLMAMMALNVKPGDEVITTSFTFVATVETIVLLGATPVFVDIDPRTYNIDTRLLEAAITPRTRLILPVSLYGQCADMDAINGIAARHDLPVIEDAAQSFGATYKGRRSCALSTIGCTSFYPAKPLGCYGDGGACFTDDDAIAESLRQIRDHGQTARYRYARVGLNGRLDTVQAAVLLAKLAIFPDEIARRQDVARRYDQTLTASGAEVVVPYVEPTGTSVYAQYTIRSGNRDHLQQALAARGIPTAIHYPVPLHEQPAYTGCTRRSGELKETEAAARQVISLPMHPYLEESTQQRIVTAVAEASWEAASRSATEPRQ